MLATISNAAARKESRKMVRAAHTLGSSARSLVALVGPLAAEPYGRN
ncbi:uncharacterized protein METZ01_LOCUS214357 [marine metagenome]|uniref:Uncharacterized protein n=1 Tax=marine metagenome TaxID=408172 RepID=A0A382FH23_9ZZZZ